jgi:Bacterial Ig-like domain (group 1)
MKINSLGKSRVAGRRESGKAQSAMEYLATYGWALLVIGAVASIVYFFASTPQILVPASCSFATGAYCQDMVIGSNVIGSGSMSSGAWLFFTNSQPYMIVNPQVQVNVSGSSSVVAGTCLPANVLPGGAILCNTVLSQTFASGVLVSGKLYFSAIPCQSGNAVSCGATGLRQSYLGSFNAQVAPNLPSAAPSVTISLATNSLSQTAALLTATVTSSNTPISGATVAFSANTPYVTLSPSNATTNSNGQAVSRASGQINGAVTVTAAFANAIATNTVTFTAPPTTSTSTTTSTTSSSTTTIAVQYVYGAATPASASSLSEPLTGSYAEYFCEGSSSNYQISSTSWTADVSTGLLSIGYQTASTCTLNLAGASSITDAGIGEIPSSYTLRTTGIASGPTFSFNYAVGDAQQYTFVLITFVEQISSVTLPSGCSAVVNINSGGFGADYIAVCSGQSPNTYTVSGSANTGYSNGIIYAAYSVG